jgi:hypothetical protein
MGICILAILFAIVTPTVAVDSVTTVVEIDPLDPFARLGVSDSRVDNDNQSRRRYGRRTKRGGTSKASKENGDSQKGYKKSGKVREQSVIRKRRHQSGRNSEEDDEVTGEETIDDGGIVDEDEISIIDIEGANFARATPDAPDIFEAFSARTDAIIAVPLTVPATSTDVFLLIGDDVISNRHLQDLTTFYCGNAANELVFDDVTGEIVVQIPGDVDSDIILCDDETQELIAIFDHGVLDDAQPTDKPTVYSPPPTSSSPSATAPSSPFPSSGSSSSVPTNVPTPTSPSPTVTAPSSPFPSSVPSDSFSPVPTPVQAAQSEALVEAIIPETYSELPSAGYYNTFLWVGLRENVRQAAATLGYNETSWDNDLPVESTKLFWSQLTESQKDAAGVLYFDKESWNLAVFPTVSCESTETWSWKDIPKELRWAVRALGFTHATWNSDDHSVWPPTAFLLWDELTESERDAAGYLGYDSSSWDFFCGA